MMRMCCFMPLPLCCQHTANPVAASGVAFPPTLAQGNRLQAPIVIHPLSCKPPAAVRLLPFSLESDDQSTSWHPSSIRCVPSWCSEEEVSMKQQPHMYEDKFFLTYVCKLDNALHGLRRILDLGILTLSTKLGEVVLPIIMSREWSIHQLDVQNVFLHGVLEEVSMKQSPHVYDDKLLLNYLNSRCYYSFVARLKKYFALWGDLHCFWGIEVNRMIEDPLEILQFSLDPISYHGMHANKILQAKYKILLNSMSGCKLSFRNLEFRVLSKAEDTLWERKGCPIFYQMEITIDSAAV
ncbi:hypothetical protein U9M48_044015 [Paspalum notatum var. saurae]|uniref:Reverse transcriptase Ty1/copia-type domain-containing protein n=1 Tax=Paspalum notatum var. saurae TaxID=547442 RepID=A0AAQ3XH20_PASNO